MQLHLHQKISHNWQGASISAAAALAGVVAFWGFTVDDALISARVAHHLATGQGYRFNPNGPIVDAVTPLGWAYVLAPFAREGVLDALQSARILGTVVWLISAAWLGLHVTRTGGRVWPLIMLAWLAPVGMWVSSGMETGLVTALVTLAIGRGALATACLGLAVAWRPELLPFAFVLTVLRTRGAVQSTLALAIVLGPALGVALARWHLFEVPYPLSTVAKPSDLTHGTWYTLEGLIWCGPLWLWLSPGWPFTPNSKADTRDAGLSVAVSFWERLRNRLPGIPRLERDVGALALAIVVHGGAIVLAGGDWMPGYRLLVPVMPAMLGVACHVSRQSRTLTCLGGALALFASVHIAGKLGPSGRQIVEQRERLIRSASSILHSAKVVAAPDVGWVGAAISGSIVDLAGVTDPAVGYLRGGHTSKSVESRLFVVRRVDHVIVLMAKGKQVEDPWTDTSFARKIDNRAAMLSAELGCHPSSTLDLPFAGQSYLVLQCPAW